MSRIGDRIKEARILQGITQKQLAKKVGVAEKYIQEVETGTKIISQDILDRIIRAVDAPINDSVIFENYDDTEQETSTVAPKITRKKSEQPKQAEVQEVWSNALSGVLADIPVFDYDLNKAISVKQLPIVSKKIDGQPKDKVMYIKIMDNDMSGFRINKYDIAFSISTHEIENNSICLLEYQGERMIRQIKKLDSHKVLLISNPGSVRTETASLKEIDVLAKLLKIEFVL